MRKPYTSIPILLCYLQKTLRWTNRGAFFGVALISLLSQVISSPSEPPTVSLSSIWESTDSWYRPCKITMQNLTEEEMEPVKIAFTLEAGIPTEHTGFSFSVDGKRVMGYLQDWKVPVKPYGAQDFVIGVNFPDGSGDQGVLPKNFCVEGEVVAPDEDQEPPSVPQNLKVLSLGASQAALSWDSSTDNVGVKGYKLQFKKESQETPSTINTEMTQALLTHLVPETPYEAKVCAVDFANNLSAYSERIFFKTDTEGPDPEPSLRLAIPYTDGLAWPTPALEKLVHRSDVTASIVGFIVVRDQRPCWGGHLSVYDSNTGQQEDGDARFSNYHKTFFQDNEHALISIGGAAGLPMCSDPSLSPDDLWDQYAAIIENYTLKGLDFDFEGGFLADTPALTRHLEAIQKLRGDNSGVTVGYTLPVDASATLQGFNHYGQAFLRLIQRHKIEPTYIQGMLMEFGQGSNPNFAEACKVGLEGMHAHIKEVFGDVWSDEKIWTKIAACPMFGRNNNGKVFTLENQAELNAFCKEKGMRIMSGWDMTRDERGIVGVPSHQPLDFSKEVAKFAKEDAPQPFFV